MTPAPGFFAITVMCVIATVVTGIYGERDLCSAYALIGAITCLCFLSSLGGYRNDPVPMIRLLPRRRR